MSGRESKWLEPQSLLGIAGFVILIWSGYQQFSDRTGDELNALRVDVATLKAQVAFLMKDGR